MERFGGAGAALWAGADRRRRRTSLVVLGLLAGFSAALAIAAVSGARRADSAFGRLVDATAAADAVVFPSQTGSTQGTYPWDDLRALPYVEDVAPWSLTFGTLDPGTPAEEPQAVFFMPSDDRWLRTTDRPIVVEGRMWDPAADGEVLVDEVTNRLFGVGVGDRFRHHVYATGQFASGDPEGPVLDLEVVGVVRTTGQFLFTGGPWLSPGTREAHPEMELIENANVRVRDPATDVVTLRADAGEVLIPGTPVLDLASVLRRVSTGITLERTAQALLGVAVALAALVFVGQALVRSVAQIDEDAEVLRAIGMTTAERAAAAARPHLVVVAVAVPVAALGAWLLSPRFPIGFARSVDPSVGRGIDWVVAGPLLVLTAVALAGGAWLAAQLRSRRLGPGETEVSSAVAAAVRAATPLPVGLGTTMAFEGGRGRRRVPVGPALLGSVLGVVGVVATLTIAGGIQDALDHPERAGVGWDAIAVGAEGDYGRAANEVAARYEDALRSVEGIEAAAVIGRNLLPIDGIGVPVFDVKPLVGDLSLVVTDGSAPVGDDEVALGRDTAEQLGVGIGDTVTIDGEAARELEVVGIALFPHDVHSGFTEGAWVTPAALADVSVPSVAAEQAGVAQLGAVRWAPDVDDGAAFAAFAEAMGPDRVPTPAQVPPELLNLEEIRSVPFVLVGFLAVLAASALAHLLVTTIRRRRQEFAVLRSIGFTGRMSAGVVAAQSTSIGLVGLAVGVPVGLALGRSGWSWIADTVPLVDASPIALGVLASVVPAALLLVNAVAGWPARWVARLRPAECLRTE